MKEFASLLAGAFALASLATAACSEGDSSGSKSNSGSGATSSGASSSSGAGAESSGGDSSGSGGGSSTGKGGSSSGGSSSSGDGGNGAEASCIAEGDDCEPGTTDCCEGACIQSDTAAFAGCRPLCDDGDDCDSGCCQQFSDASGGFCVDAAYCTCVEQGGQCGPAVPSMCCEGSTCAITEGPYLCQQICSGNDECPEECCVPLPGTDYDICAPAEWCL